jgi:hypothetical protein
LLHDKVHPTCLHVSTSVLAEQYPTDAADCFRKYRLQPLGKFLSVRFEVFTAVTMKNVAFWDIETQFILHRRHITSPL